MQNPTFSFFLNGNPSLNPDGYINSLSNCCKPLVNRFQGSPTFFLRYKISPNHSENGTIYKSMVLSIHVLYMDLAVGMVLPSGEILARFLLVEPEI
jgi:hypothetical protein